MEAAKLVAALATAYLLSKDSPATSSGPSLSVHLCYAPSISGPILLENVSTGTPAIRTSSYLFSADEMARVFRLWLGGFQKVNSRYKVHFTSNVGGEKRTRDLHDSREDKVSRN
jgi:hypothetical protein